MKIIMTYIDDEAKAEKMAKALLKEKLAACVGMWPGRSWYWWKGKIEENACEYHMIIKTKEGLVDEAMKRIRECHPYDLPVIDVIDIEKLNPDAEEWLNRVTR